MPEIREIQGKRFFVRHGGPGHEWEYCVNIEGYSFHLKEYTPIPPEIPRNLRLLTGLPVLNRGTRLEIWSPKDVHMDKIVAGLESMGLVNDPAGDFLW